MIVSRDEDQIGNLASRFRKRAQPANESPPAHRLLQVLGISLDKKTPLTENDLPE